MGRACSSTKRASSCREAAAATAAVRFAARPTCRAAGPTAATAAAAATSCCVCDDSLRDLQSFKRRAHYRPRAAGTAQGALRHGADGDDLVVARPAGHGGGRLGRHRVRPRARPGSASSLARGGHGGRGNVRFATATQQAPRLAERGLPGDEGWVDLQLKLLADIGLVGLPNAGKSTLLSRLTRAAPKIADYPFTTLEPDLGVLDDRRAPARARRRPRPDRGRAATAPASATPSSRTSSGRGCSSTSSTSRRSTGRTRTRTSR